VTLAPAKPRTSVEGTKPTPEPEPLLSDEAIAAVGSGFHTLTESVKKSPLEDLVRETLRPYSNPGWTTTCPEWSSKWCGQKSNELFADADYDS
jgi:hypothetical protein